MATVNGLTKERMLAIEAESVVNGEVVGDELILTTHDGTTIDAGNVRGPKGDTGDITADPAGGALSGTYPDPDLATEVAEALNPVGTIIMSAAGSVPSGYLNCDGSAVSRTTYAALYAALGNQFGAGDGSTTFNLPNLQGNVPVGTKSADADFGTLGQKAGAKTVAGGYHWHYYGISMIDGGNYDISGPNGGMGSPGQGGVYDYSIGNFAGSSFAGRQISAPHVTHGGGVVTGVLNLYDSYGYTQPLSPPATSVLQPYITLNFFIKT